MKLTAMAGALLAMLVTLSACESVFTYSPLSGLQRDAANLEPAAQVALAQDAINAGDVDVMLAVYEDIRDTSDPAVLPAATDLAIAISGVPSLLTEVAGQATAIDFEDPLAVEAFQANVLEKIESDIDTDKIDEAVALVEKTTASGGTPTSDQYVLAAVGLAMKVAKDVGDASVLLAGEEDPSTLTAEHEADLLKAEQFLSASGASLESLGFAI